MTPFEQMCAASLLCELFSPAVLSSAVCCSSVVCSLCSSNTVVLTGGRVSLDGATEIRVALLFVTDLRADGEAAGMAVARSTLMTDSIKTGQQSR